MKHYYIIDNTQPSGFIEVTESELIDLMGNNITAPYASKVYQGLISIDEVPEDLREQVQTVVNNKIARWGEYKNQEINSNELQSMIEEVL